MFALGGTSIALVDEAYSEMLFTTPEQNSLRIRSDLGAHIPQLAVPGFQSSEVSLPEADQKRCTHLLDALDNTVLRTVKIAVLGDDAHVCAVCLEALAVGDESRSLPCNHEFHTTCVAQWMAEMKDTCPICRHEIWKSPRDTSEIPDAEALPVPVSLNRQDLNF
jgi:hypothetical protein